MEALKLMMTAEQLISEFEQYKKDPRKFIGILQSQIDKVETVVEHLRKCHSCSLGFWCSEYKESNLAEIWNKIVFYPLEHHTCSGDIRRFILSKT